MNILEYKDDFEEFEDYQCKYKIAMLGLIHADEEEIKTFLSAEKVYVRALRKLIGQLKQEVNSAEAIKNTVLAENKKESGDLND